MNNDLTLEKLLDAHPEYRELFQLERERNALLQAWCVCAGALIATREELLVADDIDEIKKIGLRARQWVSMNCLNSSVDSISEAKTRAKSKSQPRAVATAEAEVRAELRVDPAPEPETEQCDE